jgi:putative transposase
MEFSNGGYKIRNQAAIHFITFALVGWVDVFTRKMYSDMVVDSLRFCQQNKVLWLHSWCIMSNHLRLVASATNNNLSDVLRDFKTHTSKQITSAIENNPMESRREWMLEVFQKHGQSNSRNAKYQFWRQENMPMELFSGKFIAQKINYIHNNPVKAGIVDKPQDYIYSSARDYCSQKNCGLLEIKFL